MKAKKKRTRLWSILLVLVMVVGMLPTTALAAESQTSQTADFTSEDVTTALALLGGEGKATWENNTLTLSGVNFTTTAATAVKLPDGAEIVLADNTVNTIKGGNSDSLTCYGICAEGSLTISGSGKLDVTGGTATGDDNDDKSYGIYTEGSLTISDKAEVNATGGDATGQYGYSCGIYAEDSIAISGNVTATGGTATNGSSCGIDSEYSEYKNPSAPPAYSIMISGGTVTATGGAAGSYSYGIYVLYYNTMSISGGTVNAYGGEAKHSNGICSFDGNVNISGDADVTAKGARRRSPAATVS